MAARAPARICAVFPLRGRRGGRSRWCSCRGGGRRDGCHRDRRRSRNRDAGSDRRSWGSRCVTGIRRMFRSRRRRWRRGRKHCRAGWRGGLIERGRLHGSIALIRCGRGLGGVRRCHGRARNRLLVSGRRRRASAFLRGRTPSRRLCIKLIGCGTRSRVSRCVHRKNSRGARRYQAICDLLVGTALGHPNIVSMAPGAGNPVACHAGMTRSAARSTSR